MIWLFQSYVLSPGMYGCQVWGTGFLDSDVAKGLSVHVRRAGVLKQVLGGVKRSTCNDVVLRETGQLPLEFYWLRLVVKFWNAMQHVCFAKAG